jgi:hypothetical protein
MDIETSERLRHLQDNFNAMAARLKEIEDAARIWMAVDDTMVAALKAEYEKTGRFTPDFEMAQKMNDAIAALRMALS